MAHTMLGTVILLYMCMLLRLCTLVHMFSCLYCTVHLPGASPASVLSTNHRRASRHMLCSDWSNRWLKMMMVMMMMNSFVKTEVKWKKDQKWSQPEVEQDLKLNKWEIISIEDETSGVYFLEHIHTIYNQSIKVINIITILQKTGMVMRIMVFSYHYMPYPQCPYWQYPVCSLLPRQCGTA